MTRDEFLNELQDVLQRDDPINASDSLLDYDEWDSLSKMAVMAFFDKQFGIKISLNEISQFEKVEDLLNLAKL